MNSNACNIPSLAELLHYLPTYKVVVCSLCQYAIQPTAISGHLKDIHDLYRVQRRPYMQYISQLRLSKPQDVIDLKVVAFPVPFLLVQDGLQCLSEGCGHLCVSGNRMKSHWIAKHGRPGDGAVDWQDVPLQTFFRGNLVRYFTNSSLNESTVLTNISSAPKEKIALSSADKLDIQLPNLQNPILPPPTEESLLTHYTTTTHLTLSTPTTTTLWCAIVPSLARTHPFLHHGLLALSALHLSHTTSSPSHALVAAHHQSLAMPLFRHAVAHLTPLNCDAVLIFMHFLVLYTFASEKDKALLFLVSDPGNYEKEGGEQAGRKEDPHLPPWLYFLRSSCDLLLSVWDAIQSGLVSEMAASWDLPPHYSSASESSSHTLSLISYFDTLVPSSPTTTDDDDDDELWDKTTTAIYREAASTLATALTIALPSPSPFSPTKPNSLLTPWLLLHLWPMQLTPPFLALLSTSPPHPSALILLAHYCLILRHLDGSWYFLGGAGKLLRSVLARVDGKTKWKERMEWPVREIFGGW